MLSKILVVDDSEPLHQIYKITLNRYKCEVLTALRREDGLKKLAENKGINLILVDMNMSLSRVGGLEFIKAVKKQEAYANIPIIIITSRGRNYAEEALELTEGHLTKPFTSNEVHKEVEKLFPQAIPA